MANQASVTITSTATFGTTFRDNIQPGAITIPLTTFGFQGTLQSIGTTAEDLDLGDVPLASQGLIYMRNHDQTNFVTYGLNDGGTIKEIGKMKPGEPAFFRLKPSSQLMLKADTAACNVEVKLYRD